MSSSVLPVIIRRATAADAPRLAELRYEFRLGLRPVTEERSAFLARCTAWARARLSEEGLWNCWVAEREGLIRAQVWIQLIEKLPNPSTERERHAYLSTLYVTPDLRGHGVGAMLLTTALDWCREQDVDSVVLWPTERSRSLYRRHGFAVRGDVMEALLDPAGRGLPLDD